MKTLTHDLGSNVIVTKTTVVGAWTYQYSTNSLRPEEVLVTSTHESEIPF